MLACDARVTVARDALGCKSPRAWLQELAGASLGDTNASVGSRSSTSAASESAAPSLLIER